MGIGTLITPNYSIVVLDASVWASSLIPHDQNYSSARNWLGQHLGNGGLLTAPTLLVVETAAALSRVTQSSVAGRNAASHLYSFVPMRLIPMDQPLVDAAADIAASFAVRGADSIYVALALQLSIPLVTFNNEQLTRPSSIVTTLRP